MTCDLVVWAMTRASKLDVSSVSPIEVRAEGVAPLSSSAQASAVIGVQVAGIVVRSWRENWQSACRTPSRHRPSDAVSVRTA
jgi:hypothetical protein